MGAKVEPAARKLARIASRQHGVVTRAQLLDAGVTRRQIGRRLEAGSLLPMYRGVYRVGHRAPSTEATYMAAVLAAGEGALLAGRAAAHLHGLIKGRAPAPEVVTPKPRRVEGLRTRTCRALDHRDRIKVRGIPATTVALTIVQLAAELGLEELARVCHEAGGRRRTTPRHVKAVLRRRPNSAGAAKLRAVMLGDAPALLSKLESGFRKLLIEEGLALPVFNRVAGSYRVDCRWPEVPLTVELDSYRWHNSRHSWQQGHRRAREARARGDEFRRYAWEDVFEDSTAMLTELRALVPGARD